MDNKNVDYSKDPRIVKKMAELMLQGAIMLAETCPLDGLPLFRLKNGSVVCPVHGRIILVSDEKEAEELAIDNTLWRLEALAAKKIEKLMVEDDPERIRSWLNVIEAVERIKNLRRSKQKESQGLGEEQKLEDKK